MGSTGGLRRGLRSGLRKGLMKLLFRENNYDISLNVNKYTALPDNEDEFMGLFYNEVKNHSYRPIKVILNKAEIIVEPVAVTI